MRDSFNQMEASFFAQVGFGDWLVVPTRATAQTKKSIRTYGLNVLVH